MPRHKAKRGVSGSHTPSQRATYPRVSGSRAPQSAGHVPPALGSEGPRLPESACSDGMVGLQGFTGAVPPAEVRKDRVALQPVLAERTKLPFPRCQRGPGTSPGASAASGQAGLQGCQCSRQGSVVGAHAPPGHSGAEGHPTHDMTRRTSAQRHTFRTLNILDRERRPSGHLSSGQPDVDRMRPIIFSTAEVLNSVSDNMETKSRGSLTAKRETCRAKTTDIF